MPIIFNCPCGKVLRVADEYAGRRVKCPVCQAVGTAPAPEPDFQIVEEPDEKHAPAPTREKTRPVAKPAGPRDDDDGGEPRVKKRCDEDDDEPRAKKQRTAGKGSRFDDDDDDYEDRPKQRRGRSHGSSPAPNTGKRVTYVVGGALMVLVGIALFILGCAGEGRNSVRCLIFGACVAICGFGTATKGFTGQFDDS